MQTFAFPPILAANDNMADLIAGMLVVFLIIAAVALVVAILFLLALSKALSKCKPRNRLMEPGMVWLNLIPLVNIVWMFFTVNRVSGSLKNEFEDRRMDRDGGDYGAKIGIAFCVLNLVSIIPIPIVNFVVALAAIVCFIMYWIKIAGFSAQLDRGGSRFDDDDDYDDDGRGRGRGRDRDDDEDDDRPRGRGRSRDDDDDDRPRRR